MESIEQKIGPHVSEKRMPLAAATCDGGSRSLELETGKLELHHLAGASLYIFPCVHFRGKQKISKEWIRTVRFCDFLLRLTVCWIGESWVSEGGTS